jgi:hypothetical protein
VTDRFRPFAHATAEKTDAYRAVLGTFAAAKTRFLVHLRPEDVADALPHRVAPHDLTPLLTQLVEWGNLRADPDNSRVTTVEDFLRTRYLYSLTREGEAAERASSAYDEALGRRGELQAVALAGVRELLGELGTAGGLPAALRPRPRRVVGRDRPAAAQRHGARPRHRGRAARWSVDGPARRAGVRPGGARGAVRRRAQLARRARRDASLGRRVAGGLTTQRVARPTARPGGAFAGTGAVTVDRRVADGVGSTVRRGPERAGGAVLR